MSLLLKITCLIKKGDFLKSNFFILISKEKYVDTRHELNSISQLKKTWKWICTTEQLM